MLVKSSTAVDKGSKGKFSGSSFYYGSSSLYYLTADGSFECAVPLEKEGPVQDVAWVPGNMQFVVLYGFMPAQGTLFDHKCKPLFTYGTGYRNTITWSPSGRYVALCGFGNLPGDIEFWDRVKSRLGRASDEELTKLLRRSVARFVQEILGHFEPWVYSLSTSVLPRALPLVFNAVTPMRLLSDGMPALSHSLELGGCVDGLRRCHQQGTVILAPTHTSNLDSAVLAWALYSLGLPPFTYGAGLNLFSNPLLSFFMRNLGAYRVDRQKTAPLYKDTLKEYATVTLEKGQNQLFFPGGTRSRSGRVEQHLKLGLMSCGLRAYINNLSNQLGKSNETPFTSKYTNAKNFAPIWIYFAQEL